MRIGVLGPEGSYSEKAAKIWVLKNNLTDIEFQYFGDIEDAFLAAVQEKSDISIIPVENSIEGSVGVTLDLLLEKEIVIIAEIVVKIEHCLLSKGRPEDIRVILSHPQGLAQCRHFLKQHFPEAELRSTGSTSHAARLSGEFEEMAAIASPEAAECYNLKILLSNIQDRKENYTRFLAIKNAKEESEDKDLPLLCPESSSDKSSERKKSEHESESGDSDPQDCERFICEASIYKTSIIVYLEKDRPGALYEILGAFAKRKINLTKIESRPSKRELGDYYFYIDLQGYAGDSIIKGALEEIRAKTDTLKVLGSYSAIYSSFKTADLKL
ncbi:MAG: prephenate dehydratase [Methanosarcina sp.]